MFAKIHVETQRPKADPYRAAYVYNFHRPNCLWMQLDLQLITATKHVAIVDVYVNVSMHQPPIIDKR